MALIHLSTSVATNQYISVIPLDSNTISDGVSVTVSGFGRTSDSSGVSQNLMYVPLTTITNSQCGQTYGTVGSGIVCCTGVNTQSTCNVSEYNFQTDTF